MSTQSSNLDQLASILGRPSNLCYGKVRGAGNTFLIQQLDDASRIQFVLLGEGPWKRPVNLWINSALIDLADTTLVHFHPGFDGPIYRGMTADSVGGNQEVDIFFTIMPFPISPLTFSRYAYLALHIPNDPDAPMPDITVLGDYESMQCRQFDSSGNDTIFDYTETQTWWIADLLIRKFIKREQQMSFPGGPESLVAAERARFDWPSFTDHAAYCEEVLSLSQKRFAEGGVVYINDGTTPQQALEQMLLITRSYLQDINGKFILRADQPRSSVFTFNRDNVAPGTFKVYETNLRPAGNQIVGAYRDLNLPSNSTDDATRMTDVSKTLNHVLHQRAIGQRGVGLACVPVVTPLNQDYGNNTAERVWRLEAYQLKRQLGDGVEEIDDTTIDFQGGWRAPKTVELTGYEDSSEAVCGDLVTIHKSLGEEYDGMEVEIQQVTENPDGTRPIIALQYNPNAYPDVAPPQQAALAGGIATGGGGGGSPSAPVVVVNPFDVSTGNFGTATFTSSATGVPSPSCQWQLDSGSGFADISGETSTSITISPTLLHDDGNQYRCVFTNGSGTATSLPATLHVS
jgi:hypothetical protein